MENRTYKYLRLFLAAIVGCLVAFFIFSSCMTNRKGELTTKGQNFIATYCKGEDSTSHSDKTTIIFDTIQIPYPVAGPVQYLENPCANLCDSLGRLKPFEIKKKTNGITGTIRSVGNSIAFDCKTDSLKYIIETQKRIIDNFSSEKTVIKEPCDKEHITGTQWMFIRLGQILSGFIILQCLIRIITAAWPITRPFLNWAYLFKF